MDFYKIKSNMERKCITDIEDYKMMDLDESIWLQRKNI